MSDSKQYRRGPLNSYQQILWIRQKTIRLWAYFCRLGFIYFSAINWNSMHGFFSFVFYRLWDTIKTFDTALVHHQKNKSKEVKKYAHQRRATMDSLSQMSIITAELIEGLRINPTNVWQLSESSRHVASLRALSPPYVKVISRFIGAIASNKRQKIDENYINHMMDWALLAINLGPPVASPPPTVSRWWCCRFGSSTAPIESNPTDIGHIEVWKISLISMWFIHPWWPFYRAAICKWSAAVWWFKQKKIAELLKLV